mmetsp:Transcript_22723/g.77301  ORF Transcript_22723/g.77301 Transcript_22723/m.77301 type:complete len:341 (-) Transcript_22723:2441-3463(-)
MGLRGRVRRPRDVRPRGRALHARHAARDAAGGAGGVPRRQEGRRGGAQAVVQARARGAAAVRRGHALLGHDGDGAGGDGQRADGGAGGRLEGCVHVCEWVEGDCEGFEHGPAAGVQGGEEPHSGRGWRRAAGAGRAGEPVRAAPGLQEGGAVPGHCAEPEPGRQRRDGAGRDVRARGDDLRPEEAAERGVHRARDGRAVGALRQRRGWEVPEQRAGGAGVRRGGRGHGGDAAREGRAGPLAEGGPGGCGGRLHRAGAVGEHPCFPAQQRAGDQGGDAPEAQAPRRILLRGDDRGRGGGDEEQGGAEVQGDGAGDTRGPAQALPVQATARRPARRGDRRDV